MVAPATSTTDSVACTIRRAFARERRTIAGAAARAAQRFRRIGARRKPCRRRAENDSRHERQPERERQHQERRRGADRKEMRAVKGQRKQQPRGCHCHQKSGDAAADGEQDAFGERLRQ